MCGDNTALHALWGRIMRKQLGSQTLFQCLRWLSDSIEINGPPFWIPWGLDYLLKRSRLSGGWVGAGGVVGTRAVARPAPLYFRCWSSAQQSKPLASKSLSDVGTTWWRGGGEGGVSIEKTAFSHLPFSNPHPQPGAPDSSFHHGGGSHYLPAFTGPLLFTYSTVRSMNK